LTEGATTAKEIKTSNLNNQRYKTLTQTQNTYPNKLMLTLTLTLTGTEHTKN